MGSSTYIGSFMDYQIFKIEELEHGELHICYEAIDKEKNAIYTKSLEQVIAIVTKIQAVQEHTMNFINV